MIDLLLSADVWTEIDDDVEALLDKWFVAEGDIVQAGQVLLTVVVIKASMDIVAPAAGRMDKILVPAGTTFARGAVLGRLQEVSSI